MKNRTLLSIILPILFLGLIGWWAWMANRPKPTAAPTAKKPVKIASANPAGQTASAAQTPSKEAVIQSRNLPSAAEIEAAENDPKLTAEERADLLQDPNKAAVYARFQKMIAGLNSKSLDLYGKVVDQDGQPIAGAQVKGGILLAVSQVSSESKEVVTETDAAGKFQFVGLQGMDFSVFPQKDGYEFGSKGAANWSKDYKPDPNNPMVFTMYKLQGAEPMVHSKIHDYIPCDGTEVHYDLLTGKKIATGGDLVVKLTRNPVDIPRGKPFDWQVSMQIANGGLVEITDAYPNLAPADGYNSTVSITRDATAKDWDASYRGSFYFKAQDGKIYGRILIEIQADFQPPPTSFDGSIYANPNGSRNLEWDAKNQIK